MSDRTETFVVTQGQYSDYGIAGVFSSFDKAMRCCADVLHKAQMKAEHYYKQPGHTKEWKRAFLGISGPLQVEVYCLDDEGEYGRHEERTIDVYPRDLSAIP